MAAQDTDLKQQLQELQLQQQQKLLERRKKKEQANNKKQSQAKEDVSGKFGVSDDLDLKLADPSQKGFGYVSEELVDHLNDQIRQMKDENGRLYKLLNEKDFEVRQWKKKSEENKNNTGSVIDGQVTNETAATKIIELSKKVRELTSEKEAEKTRCRQFQKKCHDLQMQLQSAPPPSEQSSVMGSMISLRSQLDSKDDDGVDVKALQDKLKQSECRLTDFRNQCQQLRQELKVAQKVLSQEIGENVNIQSLLNETSNWRGRAQQIIALQQKVDELKVQLESESGTPGSAGLGDKLSSSRRRKEEKYRDELRRMERERKEAQENATEKLKSLESEHESVKQKLDAAKTRNKVLSNEIKGQKSQVQTLLKKSRNDDEFIEALMKQQSQLKTLLEQHNQQQAQQQMQQQQQLHQMSMKSQQDSNIVEQLKAIAAQKEAQVKMLELELQHIRMVHSQNHGAGGEVTFSPQPMVIATVDSRPPTASDTETLTSSRQRELTHSVMGSARTGSRASSRTSNMVGGPAQANGQAISHISESQLMEIQHQCQEQEMMRRAVEVERDKMTELVQVLQDRLAEETQRLAEAQSELQAQKRLAVELEKRLGRQSLDAQRKGTAKGKVSARDGGDEETDEESSTEKNELLTRLEIQKDENNSLKAALQRTLKAKNEDLKVYESTLDETKKVFLEALRQMKEQKKPS
ncbi:coiled-coil domain-containing protein 13 [Aplysia californica]|uniref:Coiled-coil domain-containing protein 13 n=1 Tax=Aplysia californica TaxID=6500 RepID=A0ABM0ZWT4_APLCA|nr:coiled-coil domain-containing protein 13 [Aplysia californica]XP_012936119.1 coiled-coil domain-containing protein 13 [Aplysia californica]